MTDLNPNQGGLCLDILIHERFQIGTRFLNVCAISSPTTFMVEVEGGMNQQYQITERAVEVLPNVWIRAAQGGRRHRAALAIVAPPHLNIGRFQKAPDEERFVGGVHPIKAETI